MHLRRLELHGFKTFPERTILEFTPGVTAIVGPNGSGKSNLADAIRWVLGEQSTRLLRIKKGEDAIFAGGHGRSPTGLAEVSLILDNSQRWLPLDFGEISLTRRLYRSGETEYLVNRGRVRLRDLVDLLLQGNAGHNSYTVIGQGLVDQALSQRPEERRALLEEAAGVKRHQLRIAETQDKLGQTLRNLQRASDLAGELGPRLTQLNRLADRAAHYEQVAADYQTALQTWLAHEAALLRGRAASTAQTQRQASEAVAAARTHLEQLEQAVEAARVRAIAARASLEEAQLARSGLAERLAEQQRLAAVARERAQILAERIAADRQDLERRQAELDSLTNASRTTPAEAGASAVDLDSLAETARAAAEANSRLGQARQQLADLRRAGEQLQRRRAETRQGLAAAEARRESLRQERGRRERALAERETEAQGLAESIQAIEQERATAQAALTEVRDRLAEQREAEAQLSAASERLGQRRRELLRERQDRSLRLDALIQVEQQGGGQPMGTRAVLAAARGGRGQPPALTGIIGAVSALLAVPPDLEIAVETALGGRLHDVVVERWADAEQAIAFLRAANAGRTTFLPLASLRPRPPRRPPRRPGVIGLAMDLVECEQRYRAVAQLLLGQTWLVEELAVARHLLNTGDVVGQIVTRRGDIARPGGSVTGGSAAGAREGQNLARQRELRELPATIERLERELAGVEAELRGLEARLADLRRAASTETRAEAEAAARLQSLGREQQQREREAGRGQAEANNHRRFLASTEDELAAAQERIAQLQMELGEAERAQQGHEAALMQGLAAVDAAERLSWERREAEQALRAAAARLAAEAAERERARLAAQATRARLEAEIADKTARIARLGQQQAAARDAVAAAEPATSELAEQLRAHDASAERVRAEAHRAEATSQQRHRERAELERRLLAAERALAEAEVAVASVARAEQALLERALGEGLAELPAPTVCDDPGLERRLERLRAQLRQAGGPLGEDVVAEYREAAERHQFLTSQIADLRESEATLRRTLAELGALVRQQFAEGLSRIDESFGRYFQGLFGGGRASLNLTREDDEAPPGIEILAQPPGRRTTSLPLLSGGERALTAVALLFAILEVNPAPFCVLDEVDAALDENNIGRFAETLRRLAIRTQFIVITHNRGTMETADTLYGVSMERDGGSRLLSLRLGEPLRLDAAG